MTADLIAELHTDNLLSVRNLVGKVHQLADALEAKERENAKLAEMVQARGIGIDEIARERDSLAEQVKVLTDLSTELLKLAQKLDPIGAARFYVELATGGK